MTWITVQLTNAGFGWIQWKEWTCMRQSKWSFVSSPPFFRHLTDIVINDKVSPFQLFSTQSRQPGVVVWAAPEQQKAWDRPSTLLFAVKLFHQPGLWSAGWGGWRVAGSLVVDRFPALPMTTNVALAADVVVPVVVPSFDLRYPQELKGWQISTKNCVFFLFFSAMDLWMN